MKLKDLSKHLESKSRQSEDVEYLIFHPDGEIVCMHLTGELTMQIIKAMAKRFPKKP